MKLYKYIVNQWKIGLIEVILKYKRSLIGPFWITISCGVLICGLTFINSSIFNFDLNKSAPWVTCGIIIWTFILSIIDDSLELYKNPLRLNINIKLIDLTMINLSKNIIIFFHNIIFIVFAVIYFDLPIHNTWYILPFSALFYIVNDICVSILFGLLCLRFNDFILIIKNLTFLLFLITPIFWLPEALMSNRIILLEYNLLYHIIQIARAPLMGEIPSLLTLYVNIIFTIFLIILSIVFYKKYSRKSIYWI